MQARQHSSWVMQTAYVHSDTHINGRFQGNTCQAWHRKWRLNHTEISFHYGETVAVWWRIGAARWTLRQHDAGLKHFQEVSIGATWEIKSGNVTIHNCKAYIVNTFIPLAKNRSSWCKVVEETDSDQWFVHREQTNCIDTSYIMQLC